MDKKQGVVEATVQNDHGKLRKIRKDALNAAKVREIEKALQSDRRLRVLKTLPDPRDDFVIPV